MLKNTPQYMNLSYRKEKYTDEQSVLSEATFLGVQKHPPLLHVAERSFLLKAGWTEAP